LGRDPELASIDAVLREKGPGLLLEGEPGVGKTALLGESIVRAEARGFQVLRASGVGFEADLPFAGLHQLLRPLIVAVDRLAGPQRQALNSSFSGGSDSAPDLFVIGLAVLNLLGDAAEDLPVLVALDDCHWFDRSTCAVLAFVIRRVEADPIRFVATTREDRENPLNATNLEQVKVERLDATDAEALLDRHAPALPHDLRTRVLSEAAGNPLALVELGVSVASGVELGPGEWVPVPKRLEHRFAARYDRLPRRTQWLLLVAALDERLSLPEAVRAASIAARTDVGTEDLVPAVDGGLVDVIDGGVRFRHPLVRSAIRQVALFAERNAAHAALAQSLEASSRQVWHRAAAAMAPDEQIARELELVAAQALQQGAPTEAATALDRAAALSPSPEKRADRILRAAELAVVLGHRGFCARVIQSAHTLNLSQVDSARLALVQETFDPGIDGDPATILPLVEHAKLVADGEPNLSLSLLYAAAENGFWANRNAPTADAIRTAALAAGVDITDPRVIAILAFIAPAAEVHRVTDMVARWVGEARLSPEQLQLLGTAAFVLDAHQLSSHFHTASIDALRERGRLAPLGQSLVMRAWSQVHLAGWEIAAQDAEEALRLCEETAQENWGAAAAVVLAWLAAVRGDQARAVLLLDAADSAALPNKSRPVISISQLTRGMMALADGRHAEAYEHLRRMTDPDDLAHHRLTVGWGVANLAEAAVPIGRAHEATALIDAIETAGERQGSPSAQRAMAHARAVLADDECAEPEFVRALEAPDQPPFYRGRVQLAFGLWLKRQRRVSEARDQLRAARDVFDALRAMPWGDRARQQLRAMGESSARRTPEARDQLTAQELQVAELAAAGLSNKAIAQKLYLSDRTIGTHLYRIYPKLGITSRSELAAVLDSARPPDSPVS
jgi:DNA-binding CsgD family transcriptional regulator